ncbi:MAG TPA: hypothetical protein VLI05_03190 [Candidatus Saccharimonadia bacterium]|nr:hypothetical protein [Candidatus Saccharimonadia bacterium]
MDLRTIASSYRLTVGGIQVDTPYWINLDEPPYYLNAPYRGKGTPSQIAAIVKSRLALMSDPPATSQALAAFMKAQGLGVDCSGFAYHVLSEYLQQPRHGGLGLSHYLEIRADEVQEILTRHPERAERLKPEQLNCDLNLYEACASWHKSAAEITDVQRLTNPATAIQVAAAGEVHSGDLIRMHSQAGDHVAVVIAVCSDLIEYAASEDQAGKLGGVTFRQIRVLKPSAGLEAQDWEQRRLYHPMTSQDGVWRLKALS